MEKSFIEKVTNFFLLSLAAPLGILGIVLFQTFKGLRVPSIFFDIGGFITTLIGAGAIIVALILRMKEEEAK